jgi:CDP-diglyceride synthetase
MTEQQRFQPKGDWAFRGFLLGALAGLLVGFALVGWLSYSGIWIKYASPYIGFCALIGAMIGLFAGVLHRLIKPR